MTKEECVISNLRSDLIRLEQSLEVYADGQREHRREYERHREHLEGAQAHLFILILFLGFGLLASLGWNLHTARRVSALEEEIVYMESKFFEVNARLTGLTAEVRKVGG